MNAAWLSFINEIKHLSSCVTYLPFLDVLTFIRRTIHLSNNYFNIIAFKWIGRKSLWWIDKWWKSKRTRSLRSTRNTRHHKVRRNLVRSLWRHYHVHYETSRALPIVHDHEYFIHSFLHIAYHSLLPHFSFFITNSLALSFSFFHSVRMHGWLWSYLPFLRP